MKTPKPTVKIEKLSAFTADPHNANRHTERGASMMESSLREVGFADSLTVSRDGVILSGHQRHETVASIGMDEAIVIESDGTRPIVHVRTDIESGTAQAAKLALFANRVGEVNLSWDAEALRQLQESVDLSTLWSVTELATLIPDLSKVSSEESTSRLDQKHFHRCPACGHEF